MPGYQVAASPSRQPLPELAHVNWISNEAAQRQLQGHVLPLTLMLRVMLLEPRNVICFICGLIHIPIHANTVHFSSSWSSRIRFLGPEKTLMCLQNVQYWLSSLKKNPNIFGSKQSLWSFFFSSLSWFNILLDQLWCYDDIIASRADPHRMNPGASSSSASSAQSWLYNRLIVGGLNSAPNKSFVLLLGKTLNPSVLRGHLIHFLTSVSLPLLGSCVDKNINPIHHHYFCSLINIE